MVEFQSGSCVGAGQGHALASNHIQGKLRVLVVEDEPLIGMLLEDMLGELDATVVGPFARLVDAQAAAALDDFDVALIDMNLRGEPADDVARLLAKRGIPFALVSGSPDNDMALGATMVLQKPFTFAEIEAAVQQLSDARRS